MKPTIEDVTRRMIELEDGVSQHPDPAVPVATVIAELVGLEPSDELEHAIMVECGRAVNLAVNHYARVLGKPPDHPAILSAVGFLQGVTFARAAADVIEKER